MKKSIITILVLLGLCLLIFIVRFVLYPKASCLSVPEQFRHNCMQNYSWQCFSDGGCMN